MSIRTEVQKIFDKHGIKNKFTVRTVDFTDLARGSKVFVKIKDWKPDPIFIVLEDEVREKTGATLQGSGIG